MDKEKQRALTRAIWRERLSVRNILSVVGVVLLLALLAVFAEPGTPKGYEAAKVLNYSVLQGDDGGTPFMNVQRKNGAILPVEIRGQDIAKPGELQCLLIREGYFFGRITAKIAAPSDCSL